MTLRGMKQIDVEKLFLKDEMLKQRKEELKEFMQNIKKEHYLLLHKVLDSGFDKQYTVNVMVDLISALGNPKLGNKTKDGRLVEIQYLISIIANVKSITSRFDNIHRYKVATEIVEEFDTILFDVIQTKRNSQEFGWVTDTNALIQFDVGVNALKLEGLSRYKFPLIEKPIDWIKGASGGYHTEELRYRLTTNRGAKKQPQNVLDVLNILQSNRYMLRDIDLNEEYNYAVKQMEKRAITEQQIKDIPYNVNTRLLTCYESYCAVNELEFYFSWQFDCRGRMYSNGYDINLQADKFKKGILKPIMLSTEDRNKLEEELKILTKK